MSKGTGIEWTERTWNPYVGCTAISPGCRNCYAERDAVGLIRKGAKAYIGTVDEKGKWTDQINRGSDASFYKPLSRTVPTIYFVNSMSDLFHKSLSFEQISEVFAMMLFSPRHTFQVLTKRASRMQKFMEAWTTDKALFDHGRRSLHDYYMSAAHTKKGKGELHFIQKAEAVGIMGGGKFGVAPENVWLGVSVEDQKAADTRIKVLLKTPAAVRFLSCEPLLEYLYLHNSVAVPKQRFRKLKSDLCADDGTKIDWVIVGGESGPNARPMHVDYAQAIFDHCKRLDIPFFFKQWGRWAPDKGSIYADRLTYTKTRHNFGQFDFESVKQWPKGFDISKYKIGENK